MLDMSMTLLNNRVTPQNTKLSTKAQTNHSSNMITATHTGSNSMTGNQFKVRDGVQKTHHRAFSSQNRRDEVDEEGMVMQELNF